MKKMAFVAAAAMLTVASLSAQADGQAIYEKHCKACHEAGVGNAPKPGDKAAWEPRIAKGVDAMLQTVVSGKGAMPPKGTCMSCDEATLKAAVEVLIAQ
ncbi:c-type cytochrome [Neptuniibacter halophilus]|uniref:c-type cytochrome n=1 Tax=Neptuniibacter halophilus TaxID=651666 RepID=UPI0025745B34|nr:c-type cytochrome [Neptuniibacter halophilus]